jgi:AcrR family transcriptional regulator
MVKAQGKRQLQKVATREHILQAAMTVYLAQGFSAPTTLIAQKAGVAHGTIFVHFPKKEDLLRQALERFSESIDEKLHALSVATDNIETLLRAHIEVIEANETFYKQLIGAMSTLSEETRNCFFSLNSITSHHFGIAIEKSIEQGELKALPVHMFYNTWLGLIQYYLQNSDLFSPNGDSVIKRYKDDLINTYMTLIKK